jgi:hypothetical protein
MSYLGVVQPLSRYASIFKDVSILEIGVDAGQSMLPFIHNLSLTEDYFEYISVDIKQNLCLIEQLVNMTGFTPFIPPVNNEPLGCNVFYFIQNSLELLPDLITKGCKFDIILLDGDHNYYTVSKELEHVKELSHPSSLIVCDDYGGRWANKDLFYSSRDSHTGIDIATPQSKTEKQGVKQAVDDFLIDNKNWQMIPTTEIADFAMLYQQDHIDLQLIRNDEDKYTHQINIGYEFNSAESRARLKSSNKPSNYNIVDYSDASIERFR